MTTTFAQFRQRANVAIKDIRLQKALDTATDNFIRARNRALAELPNADSLRDHFKAIRSATLGQLAHHLETFERNAVSAGAQVHWAGDGTEACEIVVEIARRHGVKLATKGKSMATEEIHLNEALAEAGVEAVETDLGDFLVQLAGETPSHIIAPAIHKTREQVAALLSREAGRPLSADDLSALTAEARRILRERFLTAGMGISGGNIAVAETGSVVLVTNEGNGRFVTSVPPVHVAIIGIEKVAPTWDEAAVWLSLLARSTAGQPLSIYTSILTGPARADDPDGPEEVHVVLLDNGRSQLVGTKYEEVLQCIRCGACLNVCPVYREAGGHAYGSPYCGPIGAVLTPLLFGLEDYEALPHASSLCGACKDVCPARIDLPRMLLELRTDEVTEGVLPWRERKTEEGAAFVLRHQKLMRFVSAAVRLAQRPFVRDDVLNLPGPLNPTPGRQLPGLAKHSFREMWKAGELEDKG
ncbi:MAG: LutB/LldF family L-lactate oxidation iron-sulfur protein [Candidatus Poribacteria bacterium]|nr:LutB/LldF family L-lactate oxidation iron-sulfur protein [Candidatus Poribacteria bacterium]